MNTLSLPLSAPEVAGAIPQLQPFGRYLVEQDIIDQNDLVHALDLQCHMDAPLGEILISEGLVERDQILQALAAQRHLQIVDLTRDPPALHLAPKLPASLCLQYHIVPWMALGNTLLVATNRPDQFDKFRACMGPEGARLLPVMADNLQIQHQLSRLYGSELAQKAATRVPAADSCRAWEVNPERRIIWAALILATLIGALVAAPLWTITVAMLFAFVTLLMSTTLKAAAFWSQLRHGPAKTAPQPPDMAEYPLPRVSVLVPLLREKEIAGALIKRLTRLTYPKSLLEVVLVLEAEDEITKETLARTDLPDWISVIEVPAANQLTTKPRALNYALDFCKGSIIGVWDAEDAPEADQIERVVNRFREAPDNVACLQGFLDYYNSTSNWISRCFTIEYATWWRMLLPGVARLGLVIPLGGTTLFFRRDILEKLGGWDAHNVTEDADLGLRLARRGYKTELLPTVTYEEANCRAWPWVRQRSRWLKGFLITWCVHMRNPAALVKDLGWLRFWGIQTMLLATFAQFALAPLLWSFWLTLFGMTHPVEITLGSTVMWTMAGVFILAEVINLSIAMVAVSGPRHRHLIGWVLTTPLYFPMGALAAYKGLHEFVISPFFWDKTQHGVTAEVEAPQAASPLPPAVAHRV